MGDTDRSPYLVPAGSGRILSTENGPEVRIDPKVHGVGAMILEHDVEPGTLGTPHLHVDEDQIAYVLEGTLGFRVGEDEFLADAGSLVVRPRNLPHALWNPGPEKARMLEISLPGGVLEYFFAVDQALGMEGEDEKAEAMSKAAGSSGIVERLDLVEELESRHGVRRTSKRF